MITYAQKTFTVSRLTSLCRQSIPFPWPYQWPLPDGSPGSSSDQLPLNPLPPPYPNLPHPKPKTIDGPIDPFPKEQIYDPLPPLPEVLFPDMKERANGI
ncbi:uncharacterized protein I206_104592 [Kwoniella pini CBS 10737]|uniref:Uncharacterized protein n=1 Tax=Kwoniella pini CBS 10737 TaxID=1296096 RepID=A0A1B9I7A2_9TREE|nr:uncharacterized protein I206_02126 [Kwoniella pini CBS 10737]OCF51412.1 hypothetical protein I206_02126 [Kwoniella pini CBS 10737]